jgi:MYXO-CTERM domain-containing protein
VDDTGITTDTGVPTDTGTPADATFDATDGGSTGGDAVAGDGCNCRTGGRADASGLGWLAAAGLAIAIARARRR